MIETLNLAKKGSIVVLHVCAHNPTGLDPTQNQWELIREVMNLRNLIPFFDCAYQGFASGNPENDSKVIKIFQGLDFLVAQSFAKNFGLYNERCGALLIVTKNKKAVFSHLQRIQRNMISNPPAHGARIVSRILSNQNLKKEWIDALETMYLRISGIRKKLLDELKHLETPGNWEHIVNQIGMFSYTGLTKEQSILMKTKFHIYMSENGRISLAGLNTKNVLYFAKCMDWVVRNKD